MKIQPQFWDADGFSSGVAAVHVKGGWGYIDQTGTLVIQPRFQLARRFAEGVAPVRSESGWLFIDKNGTPVPNLTGFEDATSFSEGLATVKVEGAWRFITHKDDFVFGQEWANARPFRNSLATVQAESGGRYGFIDHSGKYAIKPGFEDAKAFSEGLAAVRLNRRWGYVRTNGEMQIPNGYPLFADEFAGALAVVSDPVTGAQMYVNTDGVVQFFKSRKPAEIERGTGDDYTMVTLHVSSVPPQADVYLIPAYIWDLGDQTRRTPSNLHESELKDYIKEHFEYLIGKTDLQTRVIEQTYVGLFLLGEDIQHRRLDLRIGENSASVSFYKK